MVGEPCGTRQHPAGGRRAAGGATTYTAKTAILESENRKVTVRLPTGYDKEPERKYPVVYVLDGGPEQNFEHIAGIAQSRDMNWSFDPLILVGIESVIRWHELAPPVVDPEPYEAQAL
ncbi:alpha/beta hydrolase-fold protein [Qipengyuania qiaonensis]|uniref:Esterase family protein n=1 Tax=Qipengyuania qiaonensis TaxID=2867240 RepID=A0ABS7J7I1_9SPHN|nr:alpha/beta hydrolase-fold protein [Qipengyuania qiaonensis]MBX7483280.1 hypothetical protein [Qipengyuania qiaonensis]